MKRHVYIGIILIILLGLSGCAHLTEAVKILWGSSTRALERARGSGVSETFECNVELCFQDVVDFAEEENLDVFIEDHNRGIIVLVGFDVTINTTEAGVFFEALDSKTTKVEVVSLSDPVQEKASEMILARLGEIYKEK